MIPPPTLNKEDPSENSTNEAKDASENKVDTAEEKPANDTNEKSLKETSAAECSKEVTNSTNKQKKLFCYYNLYLIRFFLVN